MKKKVLIIISLTIIATLIIGAIFTIAFYNNSNKEEKIIIGEEIIEPDRIVYRDKQDNYFQFIKGEENYNQIIELLKKSITSYDKNGKVITDQEIDEIHSKSFIEFDYETISKNYIIQLEENEEQAVIRLANSGGAVVTPEIKHLNKIKTEISEIAFESKPYKLEYEEMISRNQLQTLEYKYQQEFKEINYKIYQTKIKDMEDYEKFSYICNFAFEEPITEDVFAENDLILTVSSVPKINVKVNIGNIKYTYDKIQNANMQYTVHLLKVSKIVNTDCIYNLDLTEIQTQIDNDNFEVKYDEAVDNLDKEIFMKDYEEFIKQYEQTTTNITEEKASEIAEKGFKEAERICGSYKKNTQQVNTETVKPNKFFTRKINEGDHVYEKEIECYTFMRSDEMLNGVKIYVDKRTGKIVGGGAFGD